MQSHMITPNGIISPWQHSKGGHLVADQFCGLSSGDVIPQPQLTQLIPAPHVQGPLLGDGPAVVVPAHNGCHMGFGQHPEGLKAQPALPVRDAQLAPCVVPCIMY